jgi:hypothetical protein
MIPYDVNHVKSLIIIILKIMKCFQGIKHKVKISLGSTIKNHLKE